LTEGTPLEKACKLITGDKFEDYYNLLGNILLLNFNNIKDDDPRLSAKVTSILFDNGLRDKAHLICLYLENPEINIGFNEKETETTKKLLNLDPELNMTQKIVDTIVSEKVVSEEQLANLQIVSRADLERYMMEAKAKFIHRY
jgi:hypothetical protein